MYRGRTDAENRIKELKYGFSFDNFNLYNFYSTEAVLMFVIIAYNLIALFRTFVLQEKNQKTLSALKHKTFAVGACF